MVKIKGIRISLFFRWYDLWVGVYIFPAARTVFICPLPMMGLRIEFPRAFNDQDLANLLDVIEEKKRLERLTNQQLVAECLHTPDTDMPVINEMMTRLDPLWGDEGNG